MIASDGESPTQFSAPSASAQPGQALAMACSQLRVDKGVCHVFFAYDVGRSIDLNEAERRIQATTQRESFKHKRRAPRYFNYVPAPLRVTTTSKPVALDEALTDTSVDFMIFDFGAVSVTYRIPLQGPLSHLLRLSDLLYDNERLLADSRRGVEQLLSMIAPAVAKPFVADLVEDYAVYQIEACSPEADPRKVLSDHASPLAQVLRAETETLSQDQINDTLACRIQFASQDMSVIDWNACLLFGTDAEDTLAVLEYANVELLEMRYLDDQLDDALDQSYETFSRRTWTRLPALRSRSAELRRVAELQLDSALLFEGVNNALKLLGDQYLARVYRLAAQRLHLEDWDGSIIRKLNTLESIYQKLSDQQSTRRMEVLEWIIIILIAVSILLPMLPGFGSH